MSDMAVHFSSDTAEWETPQDLFDTLDREFHFTLDPCATDANHKCEKYFTKEQDGLIQDWSHDIFFMNPVYGDGEQPCKKNRRGEYVCKKKRCPERGYHVDEYQPGVVDFIRKAVQSVLEGATGVCLIPARTDTEWFSYVWSHKRHAPRKWVKSLRFVKGRLKFGGQDSPAPFPSVIVVMGR